ncbi:DUF4241 domain-containing protein [Flavobacterium litorale]|uniref:DUF4241 domain-containing protein n=1 Tax=Flavobacterium litorale TaxID=2856519 RepID=A0ABX8V3U8_9FLAO|nr:DUF4241 domain-containing protein [Flavobacterium litorale]QYJ67519.1 DUF4241 domain-containing protein [Flavobacterium litorale]
MKNTKDHEIPYELKDDMNAQELVEIHIGDINLPTGKIIVTDPFFRVEQQPFFRKVTPGTYPVYVYMSEIDELHHRVAYSKIKFKAENASKWIMALTDDITPEEIDELGENEFYGFAVESGLACFIDEKTNTALAARMEALEQENPEGNYYDDVLAGEFKKYSGSNKYSRNLGDWNNHLPNKDSEDNAMMFAAGWGDGYYPVYWGLNEAGEAVELIIDFLINEFEEEESNGFRL